MSNVQIAKLPADAMLASYVRAGAYTDCFSTQLSCKITFADYVEAFYTTPLFKMERWIIARVMHLPSTDEDARELSLGITSKFAAWKVEAREESQMVLAAGRTRSWLMISPQSGDETDLLFGSAVVHGKRGKMGWHFRVLLGFHKLYSRLLLGAAARRLSSVAKP